MAKYWVVLRPTPMRGPRCGCEGRGWVRIDPTAAVAPEHIYDTLADRAPGTAGLLGRFGGTTWNVSDWLRRNWNDVMLGFDADRQSQLLKPLGIERLGGQQLTVLFSLTAVLALLWMIWLSARGQREPDPVLRAWHRLSRRYRRFGLQREPHETAAHWVDRIGRSHPDLAAGLRELSHRFAIWRYAEPQPGARSTRATKDLIHALRSHRPQRSNP